MALRLGSLGHQDLSIRSRVNNYKIVGAVTIDISIFFQVTVACEATSLEAGTDLPSAMKAFYNARSRLFDSAGITPKPSKRSKRPTAEDVD